MNAIHPSDAQLGARLLAERVLYSLACNTIMVPHDDNIHMAVCDPTCCGWHSADVRVIAAGYRRFDVPDGNVPDTVWVISTTGHVPGIIHKTAP